MTVIRETSTRAVPSHELLEFCSKVHQYALVIPVIDEGERLVSQLRQLSALKPRADIIVADGGSTDGSVSSERLRSQGVRALLIKRDTGKLSAQLRMAYAWCLDQEYRGIVTVDGNGKDGLDAIERFLEKLDAGYDYVQGSRYRPSGQAINTPLDRKLAGRLIHAPLLSICGRRWYTDTTNGFRAYSAGYLRDPRVAPFRKIFDRYALLFYLTARAGQLGYRTCEIPVTRKYPDGARPPTKISGIRGRLVILVELLKVMRGSYNP